MHFAIFVVYLANVLANRACSMRLSTFLLQHQLFVYYIVPNFTFSGAFVNEVVPRATIYKITRFYLNINYWDIKL